jgi:hypothetical protein
MNEGSRVHGQAAAHDHVYLAGWPSLKGFLEDVSRRAAHWPVDRRALVASWQKAHARILELKASESGGPERIELQPLPDSMQSIAAATLEDAVVQQSMLCGAYAWKMVELDRLIVHQRTIDLHHVARLRTDTLNKPTDDQLIRMAVGQGAALPPSQVHQQPDNAFSLLSPSSDVRFLETTLLRPENLQGVQFGGHPAMIVCVAVGFGINVFNALQFRNRVLLLNGSHRLYELRARGVTHAPMLVQSLSRETELELVRDEIRQQAHLYFSDARPPMFKDYFNPELHLIVPMVGVDCMVQVQVLHQKQRVPTL